MLTDAAAVADARAKECRHILETMRPQDAMARSYFDGALASALGIAESIRELDASGNCPIRGLFNEGLRSIMQQTFGVVRPQDVEVWVGPSTLGKWTETEEVKQYLASKPGGELQHLYGLRIIPKDDLPPDVVVFFPAGLVDVWKNHLAKALP